MNPECDFFNFFATVPLIFSFFKSWSDDQNVTKNSFGSSGSMQRGLNEQKVTEMCWGSSGTRPRGCDFCWRLHELLGAAPGVVMMLLRKKAGGKTRARKQC
jgi:hypothetical protein